MASTSIVIKEQTIKATILAQGPVGPQGVVGPTGPTGPQGIQGPIGLTGGVSEEDAMMYAIVLG